MNFKEGVYRLVKNIPSGKVLTYGLIAQKLGKPRWSRQVGWALHQNKEGSGVPCHRVVDRNGRLAPNFAFEGAGEQHRRLAAEGVRFADEMHVDLSKCLQE
jgi:methylated-DNA-protein-cysteine methyltransferase-like protein